MQSGAERSGGRVTIITTAAAAAFAGVWLFAAAAGAGVVLPGETVPLSGVEPGSRPELEGEVVETLVQVLTLPWNGPSKPPVDLRLEQRVVRETVTGTLDFYYRLTNVSPGEPGEVIGVFGLMTVAGFGGFATEVEYLLGGNYGWNDVSRSADGQSLTLGFPGFPGLDMAPGETTAFLFVRTNATRYARSGEFTVSQYVSPKDPNPPPPVTGTVSAFAPVIPLPPAAAAGLLGLGAVAAGRWLSGRRRA